MGSKENQSQIWKKLGKQETRNKVNTENIRDCKNRTIFRYRKLT